LPAQAGNFASLLEDGMEGDERQMSIVKIIAFVTLMGSLVGLVGCSHKLVGRAGESTINVFPTKHDFDNVMAMKSRGGAEGMVGGLGENFMAKKVPQNTTVKIISSDSEGADIQVVEGPDAGLRGYVAKDNVD
jgi:hypothetical protein